jgi:hypothetical protein
LRLSSLFCCEVLPWLFCCAVAPLAAAIGWNGSACASACSLPVRLDGCTAGAKASR